MIRHKIYQILIIIFAFTLSACEETFVEAFGVENPSGEVVPPQDEQVIIVLGEVITNVATDITESSVKLSGEIVSKGNSDSVEVGFLLYTGSESDFTTATNGVTSYVASVSGNSFSKSITSLTYSTKYKFRAYIKNEAGISYGTVKNFTTETGITQGEVTTNAATEITSSQARLNGDLVSTGNSTNYTIGFILYQGNLTNFTLTTSGVQNFEVPNSKSLFTKLLNNLTENTTYKFRAYITNEEGTSYGTVKTFTTEDVSLRTLTGHTNMVFSASYSPDGTKIVSASYDDNIKIWDANTGACLQTLTGHTIGVFSASYSPDGTKIVSASWDNTIKIWNANTGTCLQTLTGHTNFVHSASYSPDGTKIVSASMDNTIKIWDANTGTCLQTLTGHTNFVESASYSPDGTKIVSASNDETIKIWNANTGTCLQTLTGHTENVNSASYSPDGTKIVSASGDNTIKIWDANTGTCLQTLTGHTNVVESASYSPDGTKIVSASNDNKIKIWDANTGTCLRTLTGHTDFVISASYSPDGTKIVSASRDNTIKIWGEN